MKKTRNINLTEGSIYKGIIAFSIPLLLSNFLQQLYNTADLVIVGRFAGKNPMAAVGSTGQISALLIGLFFGLTTGASVVVSQVYGAKDRKKLEKSITTSYAIAILGGIILTIVGILLSPWILRAVKTPDEIMDMAVSYMRIFFLGMIPLLVYNMGSGILRSMGDSKRPFNFLLVAAITNIILDIILVAVFKMSVEGAGWATFFAQVISAILVTYSLIKSDFVRLNLKNIFKIDTDILKEIFNIGIPAGIQSAIISFSNVLIQSKINEFGADVIAAYSAGGRIDNFIYMGIVSVALSATTFTGQNIGSRNYNRVRQGTKVSIIIGVAVSLCLSLFTFVFADPLIKLFNKDPYVVEVGKIYIRILCTTYFIFSMSEVLGGVIRGAGFAMAPMLISIVFMCGARMIWIYIVLKMIYRVEIIFMAWPVTWVLAFIANYFYYKFGKWRRLLPI